MRNLIRAGVKSSWRAVAGMTPRIRVLPDFLILGGQKCGTTSLFNYLIRHPQVSRPTMKEVHFFDRNFERGIPWYRAHFPTQVYQQALRRTRGGGHALTGESSPCYLAHPLSPRRVALVVPEARFIVLLRDPVQRAYSHYRMRVRQGKEHRDFADAIRAEEIVLRETRRGLDEDPDPEARIEWEVKRYQSFLYRGRYQEQVQRWFKYFPAEQFLFMKSEEFFRDEATGFACALEFLDLEPWRPRAFRRYNDSGKRSAIPPEIRARLYAYFERHNGELPQMIGEEFQWPGRPE